MCAIKHNSLIYLNIFFKPEMNLWFRFIVAIELSWSKAIVSHERGITRGRLRIAATPSKSVFLAKHSPTPLTQSDRRLQYSYYYWSCILLLPRRCEKWLFIFIVFSNTLFSVLSSVVSETMASTAEFKNFSDRMTVDEIQELKDQFTTVS